MALELAAKVVATVPSPGADSDAFASVAVTPLGKLDQASEIAELNTPWCAVVTLRGADELGATVTDVADGFAVKLLAVTTIEKYETDEKPPAAEAVAVMLYVPAASVCGTTILRVMGFSLP